MSKSSQCGLSREGGILHTRRKHVMLAKPGMATASTHLAAHLVCG